MTKHHNPNCDGGRCAHSTGEVRVYPLVGGANLILCRSCWEHENQFRAWRQKTASPGAFPQVDWHTAEGYKTEEV